MTLIEFLLTRIDEDEQVACDATAGPWAYEPPGQSYDDGYVVSADPHPASLPDYPSNFVAMTSYDTLSNTVYNTDNDGAHIARWNPSRVLAECAAKRAIVARAQAADDAWQAFDGGDGYPEAGILARISDALDGVIRDLATPYADHPDFAQEWAAR